MWARLRAALSGFSYFRAIAYILSFEARWTKSRLEFSGSLLDGAEGFCLTVRSSEFLKVSMLSIFIKTILLCAKVQYQVYSFASLYYFSLKAYRFPTIPKYPSRFSWPSLPPCPWPSSPPTHSKGNRWWPVCKGIHFFEFPSRWSCRHLNRWPENCGWHRPVPSICHFRRLGHWDYWSIAGPMMSASTIFDANAGCADHHSLSNVLGSAKPFVPESYCASSTEAPSVWTR
jgi:hypothetical protein